VGAQSQAHYPSLLANPDDSPIHLFTDMSESCTGATPVVGSASTASGFLPEPVIQVKRMPIVSYWLFRDLSAITAVANLLL
jgi:hypothetical protein